MKKIVFCKVHPPYLVAREKEWAGREYRERWLPRQTQDLGYQSFLFVLGEKPYPITIEKEPEVTFCPVDNKSVSKNKHTSQYLLQRIKEIEPDLIVFKGLAYKLSSWLLEQTDFKYPFAFIVGGNVQDKYLNKASYILSETREQTLQNFRNFWDDEKVSVLPKSLDLDVFVPNENKRFDIVNVGSFEPRKNHVALCPLFPKYKICLVGDGPTYAQIKSLTGNNIYMPKNVGTKEVAKLISESKIMVHPSKWEGFPRTLIESLACGVPVIALSTTIKGIIQNGETGFLVDENNLIQHAMDLLKDDQLIDYMGNKGRQMALESYGKTSTVKILQRMYQRLWG